MKILDALKSEGDVRLTNKGRWLYWQPDDIPRCAGDGKWVVRKQEYRKRNTTVSYFGQSLDEAVKVLLAEEE